MAATRKRPALVLTAGMGAGHNGVAAELAARLDEAGTPAVVVDVLEVMPLRTGQMLRGFYSLMVRHAPWLYDLVYAVWFRPRGRRRAGPVSPVTLPIERFVRRWVADNDPVVAVSVFHLCSQVLGHMRSAGTLRVPAVTVVVDPAVSRLWVHPAVDHHLCSHPAAAASAAGQGAPAATAPGPVVRRAFHEAGPARERKRAELGAAPADRLALVSGGSWGVGAVEETVKAVLAASSWKPVVVCGGNDRLQETLRRQEGVIVLGFVDDMPELMAASDVYIDNAGGLTAMEALAAGLPVVFHRPLPGHGRANLDAMASAGWATDARGDLPAALEALEDPGTRRALRARASSVFATDPAAEILRAAGGGGEPDTAAAGPAPAARAGGRRRLGSRTRGRGRLRPRTAARGR